MRAFEPDILSQALAEPSRRAILENLRYGQKSVTELVRATELKQPNVSNHLAKMRQQGIVRAERIGRLVYYSIATPFADVLLRLHEFAAHPLSEALQTETSQLHPWNADQNGKSSVGAVPPELLEWQKAFFYRVLAGEEDRAGALVNTMLSQHVDMVSIYIHIFAPALHRIGDMYEQGLTDEAHEHVASGIIERMMAKVAQFYVPVGRVERRAILGCVAGNWHSLGLRMLADGLKTMGWEALFVGANVPTASFVALVRGSQPDLVVISCSMADQWEETLHLIHALDAVRKTTADGGFAIVVGGHYLQTPPQDLTRLPIDFSTNDLSEFLEQIRARFGSSSFVPPV